MSIPPFIGIIGAKVCEKFVELQFALHPFFHACGWINGHSHSFWDGEKHYCGRLCDCGKVTAIRPTGMTRKIKPVDVYSPESQINFRTVPSSKK